MKLWINRMRKLCTTEAQALEHSYYIYLENDVKNFDLQIQRCK